jgi:hypothetical protein
MRSGFLFICCQHLAKPGEVFDPSPYPLPQGERGLLDNLLKKTASEAHRISPLPLRERVG